MGAAGENGTFELSTARTSYVIELAAGAVPGLSYWGPRCEWAATSAPVDAPYRVNAGPRLGGVQLEGLSQECGLCGSGDFRRPALQVTDAAGFPVTELAYRTHRLLSGKPMLSGLPAARLARETSADTLEIELTDERTGLEVVLSYTAHEAEDVIARSTRLKNAGAGPLLIDRVMSVSFDLPRQERDLETTTLPGAWAAERSVSRTLLTPGVFATESTRGTSSHIAHPFLALAEYGAGEADGEVFAAALVYSGNFLAEVDASLDAHAPRVNIGINPFAFRWLLEPGEEFSSPEALLVYSHEGLGGVSRAYHQIIRNGILPKTWVDRERPVLLNSWEAQYFDVDEKRFLELADAAAEVGCELVVLDDGWFGARDDDTSSLGDWRENPDKLPHGLEGLARRVHQRGLRFGLWVEPEMISPDSDLYRSHPDWCLHIPDAPGRARGVPAAPGATAPLGRNQLVLDMTRRDVQDWMIETFSDLFTRADVDYVKWDMNRSLAPAVSPVLPEARRGESAHRYVLGLYRVLEELTRRFPEVLFEGCAGGGGRFDAGMLFYMPQIWTSDNTDAVDRLFIQYGTSLAYPPVTMGAHISAVPNHQVGRITPLETRAAVALSANFGLELDLRKLSAAERANVAGHVAVYKQHRRLVQFGRFLRLESPFEGNRGAWQFVSEDGREVLVVLVRVLAGGAAAARAATIRAGLPGGAVGSPGRRRTEAPLRLRGLAEDAAYRDEKSGRRYTAAMLEAGGLPVELPPGDYASALWYLTREP